MNNNSNVSDNNIVNPLKKTMVDVSILGIGNSGYKIIKNLSTKEKISGLKKIVIDSDINENEFDQDIEIINFLINDNNLILIDDEFVNKLKAELSTTKLLIVTTGLGGIKTKSILPLIQRISSELNILLIFVVTSPFSFEGSKQRESSIETLEIIKKMNCSYVLISNDKLLNNYPDIAMVDAYQLTNNAIKNCINSFVRLCFKSSITNVAFNEIFPLINNKNEIYIGFGNGVGKYKITKAIESSLNSKIIDKEFKNATNILINIIADQSVSIVQVNEIINILKERIRNDKLNILFSFDIDKKLRNEIQLNFIATWDIDKSNCYDYKSYLEKENLKVREQLVKIGNTLEFEIFTKGKNSSSLLDNELNYSEDLYHQGSENNDKSSIIHTNDDEDIPSFLK